MGKVAPGLLMALALVAPLLAGAPAHATTRAPLTLVQCAALEARQETLHETALTGKHEDDCAEALEMIHYACGSGDPWACLGAHLGSLAGGCGWQ